jgi:hypothetical protein
MGSMRREGCYDRRYLPHHTEPSRSELLVSQLAGQLKCRIRYLVSDCSKLLRRPGPLRTGPSIEKPSLREKAGRDPGRLVSHDKVVLEKLFVRSSHPLAPCRATSRWPSAVYWAGVF